jgi:predicted glycogen debranching enzyme
MYCPGMFSLGHDVLTDLSALTAREWLVTNGIGGFASGTVSGVATRRYHGLLVAALSPPRGRHVLVSHVDERLVVGANATALSSRAFPDVVTPDGWTRVQGFSLDPLPTWTLRVGDAVLERSVSMVRGKNATVLRYTLREGERSVLLGLRPFCAFRDFHGHARVNPLARIHAEAAGEGRWTVRPYDGFTAVHLRAPGVMNPSPDWWRDFDHALERGRGLDAREDLFTPGEILVSLAPGETVCLAMSTEPLSDNEIDDAEDTERARLLSLPPPSELDPVACALHVAVDAYRASVSDPPALLAGYPWFEDWGRDTLIAFTGAYLVTGRHADGRAVLAAFARYVDGGMVPNRFPDGAAGGADYNTVDAPLWLFYATRRYRDATGDEAFVREVMRPALEEIARSFRAGTRYGIRVGDDGLLYAGEQGTQLTWMDAKVGDWVVTPRRGAPVEINALWHHALRLLAELADDPIAAAGYAAEADRAREVFNARFWSPATGYLRDVVGGPTGDDDAVRPNALYALALPGELVPLTRCEAVLTRARSELLVPLAVRTLSPRDPSYRGRFEGDPWSRDGAYHQGTAWPFLLGAYTRARVVTAERSGDAAAVEAARAEVRALLSPLSEALSSHGLGHLPEVYDGDAPHRAGGCFAQAWSDCEALRALVEDARGQRV